MDQDRGFSAIIRNRDFLFLWLAQVVSQTAQNGIHFVQIVLIETLTGSSTHVAIVILAFSLPAVLLSSVAGIVVDRFSNKAVMLASNGIRVLTVTSYLLVIGRSSGARLLICVYALTFLSSAIAQFFGPAEATTIPLLVGEEHLLTANALFSLTLTGSQALGLMVVAPLSVKVLGIKGTFGLVALMYLAASALLSRIPRDHAKLVSWSGTSITQEALQDLREGWRFVATNRSITVALTRLTLMTSLVMILAMVVPGYAARVLSLQPEDAVLVFGPAALGMFVASFLVGRFGHAVSRHMLSSAGLLVVAILLTGFGLVGLELSLWRAVPRMPVVMVLSCALGAASSVVVIPSMTLLQEESPPEMRGRVIAVYFTLANLAGLLPMLLAGVLADTIGIGGLILLVSLSVLLITGLTIYKNRELTLKLRPERNRPQA